MLHVMQFTGLEGVSNYFKSKERLNGHSWLVSLKRGKDPDILQTQSFTHRENMRQNLVATQMDPVLF